jgi:hypothetical protein
VDDPGGGIIMDAVKSWAVRMYKRGRPQRNPRHVVFDDKLGQSSQRLRNTNLAVRRGKIKTKRLDKRKGGAFVTKLGCRILTIQLCS